MSTSPKDLHLPVQGNLGLGVVFRCGSHNPAGVMESVAEQGLFFIIEVKEVESASSVCTCEKQPLRDDVFP